jgi:thiol:disulfide interchange protein DsbC
MNIKNYSLSVAAGLVMVSLSVSADTQQQTDPAAAIRETVAKLSPTAVVDNIKAMPLERLYEVTVGTDVLYVTQDGRYVLHGDLLDIANERNLSEQTRSQERSKVVSALNPEDMIIFGPAHPKHTVTVFTDIDCPYCRKMHSQMADYNRLGIAFRYLAYPRAGLDSESYHKAVAVWCNKDRQQAMSAAKSGQAVTPEDKNCNNPVAGQLALAHHLNVNGTPSIILENGAILPGYVPPEKLDAILNDLNKGT